jgi:hypothetical protein
MVTEHAMKPNPEFDADIDSHRSTCVLLVDVPMQT